MKAIARATLDKTRLAPKFKGSLFKNLLNYLKSLYSFRIVLRTFYHFYESVKNFYMNKQRICVVGDGLTGLMTAITLNNIPELEVNLVAKKQIRNKDKRTTAISDTNFEFLKENIKGLKNSYFWSSKKIELFYETKKNNINFFNLNEKKSNLMHVFENNKIRNVFFKEILKRKINIIKKKIKNLNELKEFDLIILCLGGNSKIYAKISKGGQLKRLQRNCCYWICKS